MRKLLVTAALLAASAGAARAEAGAAPAPPEKPAKAQKAAAPASPKGKRGGVAKKAGGQADAGAKSQEARPGGSGERDGAAPVTPRPDPKPCEPVKPCPIE